MCADPLGKPGFCARQLARCAIDNSLDFVLACTKMQYKILCALVRRRLVFSASCSYVWCICLNWGHDPTVAQATLLYITRIHSVYDCWAVV